MADKQEACSQHSTEPTKEEMDLANEMGFPLPDAPENLSSSEFYVWHFRLIRHEINKLRKELNNG